MKFRLLLPLFLLPLIFCKNLSAKTISFAKDTSKVTVYDFCLENDLGFGMGDGTLIYGCNIDFGFKRFVVGVRGRGGLRAPLNYVPAGYHPATSPQDPGEFFARPSEFSPWAGYRVLDQKKSNIILAAGYSWHRQQIFYYTGADHSPHDLYTGVLNKLQGISATVEFCEELSENAGISFLVFYSIYNEQSSAGLMFNFRFGVFRMK